MMARQIFGDTVDYAKVRVHMTPYFGDPSVTVGNDIYMEMPSLHSDDYSEALPSVQADLDHEIEHVQQKQNNGVLKDFFLAVKMARGYVAYKLFDDFSVYEYQLSENTDFAKLNSEQQASMVQDYKLVRERFRAAGCTNRAAPPACDDLTPKIKLYERKIGEALPLPGALTFKPG